jgi:hypothetical protein
VLLLLLLLRRACTAAAAVGLGSWHGCAAAGLLLRR